MTTIQTPVGTNPSHTFLDSKPPLMPRQSTGDVLSFTKIIADRLAPGQNVWDYFSPAPASTDAVTSTPCSPSSSGATSPTSPTFSVFGNKRQSAIFDASKVPSSPPQCASPTQATFSDLSGATSSTTTPPSSTTTAAQAAQSGVTPKTQKRRSFVQSLRNMLSLSQLLSSSAKSAQPTGPPHYNILVLGSDSAPLASTLYKMSSLMPNTNKISHYQEISGFFVAYFRSTGSFTCSPKTSTEVSRSECDLKRRSVTFRAAGDNDEIKSRGSTGSEESDQSDTQRSSQESETTLSHFKEGSSSSTETYNEDKETVGQEGDSTPVNPSANASLSIHAFSLDTTWPVPRVLAQTFWFPYAHGIIYIVDATRKNDPRGMDHLVNARQFLSSLMADPHFKRRDIPVVVFANKAGMDDETCFRVDEIADILGCEDWDDAERIMVQPMPDQENVAAGTPAGTPASRPWCVKSTRSDGNGDGIRESVEWLKSRCSEIWK
ncbi:hypothetical protein BGZ51_007059 [Haplosporangium sp. Z 767]|nr:hypothetical protein BGZ50_002655 [Haplosporangium sp. Z 11]KAF9194839.1 hypothetical protein BGZ51_007059 [Haplosporangium sp. Z 767]